MKPYDIEAVSTASALRWLAGGLHVGASIAAAPVELAPEVVFVNELGDNTTAAVKRIRRLAGDGCRWIVAHVCNDRLALAMERRGFVTLREEKIIWQGQERAAWRMAAPPERFAAWLQKISPG